MARLPSLEGEHTNQVDWHRQKLVAISPVLHDRGYRAPITSGLPLSTDIGSIGRHVSKVPCADIRQSKKGRQLPALLMPHYVLSLNQMRDLGEYLRAYVAYVSANLGWGKALRFVLVWLAGMFLPLGARTLVQLPEWVAMTWMVGWALLGYIFAPYGMWKHHRAQIASSIQPTKNSRGRGLC